MAIILSGYKHSVLEIPVRERIGEVSQVEKNDIYIYICPKHLVSQVFSLN